MQVPSRSLNLTCLGLSLLDSHLCNFPLSARNGETSDDDDDNDEDPIVNSSHSNVINTGGNDTIVISRLEYYLVEQNEQISKSRNKFLATRYQPLFTSM